MQILMVDVAEDVSGTGTDTLLWSFTKKLHRMKKGWLTGKNVRIASERIEIHWKYDRGFQLSENLSKVKTITAWIPTWNNDK